MAEDEDVDTHKTPDFSKSEGLLNRSYWSDVLCDLVRKNANRIINAQSDYMNYLTPGSVNMIFTLCIRLRLPNEVRFLAALIFDRFMNDHVDSLYRFVDASKLSIRRKRLEWEKVESNVSRQCLLRIVSSIQLASKLFDYHSSLSSTQVVAILRTLGQAYTNEAILNSEIRILKSMNFTPPISPITYAETILTTFGASTRGELGSLKDVDRNDLWQYVVILMDMYFLHHQKIYKAILQEVLGSRYGNISVDDLTRVKQDYMLLGSGIVAAAFICMQGATKSSPAFAVLSRISGTPQQDIQDFARILVEVTIEEPGPANNNNPARSQNENRSTSNLFR